MPIVKTNSFISSLFAFILFSSPFCVQVPINCHEVPCSALHFSFMNCTTQMTQNLQDLFLPWWLLVANGTRLNTKNISFYKCTLPCLLCCQCLSLRENKESRAFWHGGGEKTGEAVLYNDETAKTAHWIDVDLKDFYRALFELSPFL